MKKNIKKKLPAKKSFGVKVVSMSNKNMWLKVLGIANVLFFLGVLVINYLAVQLPLGGMTTGALSDLYPNLFTPAGLTFSIWGVIYLLLFGFVVWQLVDLYKKQSRNITKKIGVWFLLSCIANMSWLFARHYAQLFLSVLIMLFFLIVLIVISYKIELGKKIGSRGDKMFVHIPFSLYLGWISVATIANISTWLVNIGRGMRAINPIFWTMLMIIIATLLALLALYKKHNIIFALVVVRAFIGIIIKTLGAEVIYGQIVRTLGVCIAIITTGIGLKFEQWKKN